MIRIDAIWLATEPMDMRAGIAPICLQTVAPLALKSWYMTGLAFGRVLAALLGNIWLHVDVLGLTNSLAICAL